MPSDCMTEWLRKGRHLPREMRDFHDQKDLFKAIFDTYHIEPAADMPSWVQAHVFTIDKFLWFMAKHGWTLQRSRKHLMFADLRATMDECRKRRMDTFARYLKERHGEGGEERADEHD